MVYIIIIVKNLGKRRKTAHLAVCGMSYFVSMGVNFGRLNLSINRLHLTRNAK